jgi:thiol-disulfide isomerase/thioredoxin
MGAIKYGMLASVILSGLVILGLVVYSYWFLDAGQRVPPISEVITSDLIARTARGEFLDKRAQVDPKIAAPLLGYLAPDFELPLLAAQGVSDGTTVRLSDFRGRPVLLNFWATWCPPCRKEIPELQRFHKEYGDRIVLIGINWNDEPQAAADLLKSYDITYLNVIDRGGEAFVDYRLTALPTSFWIDEQGIIRGVWHGAMTLETLVEGFKKTTRALGDGVPK